jgi:hypothetical protein
LIVNWKSFNYLGMPIFQSIASSQDWKAILDKLTNIIQSWGARWLNPVGKIVLIKSVLSALTIFQCAGLMAPKGILEKISRTLRGFLWEGGKTNTKKNHLVNWTTVCQPTSKGGLAIHNPSLMNIFSGRKVGLAPHLKTLGLVEASYFSQIYWLSPRIRS